MEKGFSALQDIHDSLDEVFWCHQEVLVVFQFAAAGEILDIYEALLDLHMRHEEAWLLPLARDAVQRDAIQRDAIQRETGPGHWPPDLYLQEHGKMKTLLAACKRTFAQPASGAGALRRQVIAALDWEGKFKHLSEHHHEREHKGLFPLLEKACTPEVQEEITTRCLLEWTALKDSHMPRLAAVMAKLPLSIARTS